MATEVNNDDFDEVVLKDKDNLVVVDLWATWCGPCKTMGPIFDDLANDYKDKGTKFVKVNLEGNENLAALFGVVSIPTFLLFSKGSLVGRVVGAVPKKSLATEIDKALEKHNAAE